MKNEHVKPVSATLMKAELRKKKGEKRKARKTAQATWSVVCVADAFPKLSVS